MRLRWYRNLYCGTGKRLSGSRIVRDVRKGKKRTGAYVVALAANKRDLLDLYPVWTLQRSSGGSGELRIVGVAGSRAEAIDVVRQIIQDTYDTTGGVDVRARFRPEEFTA